MDMMKAAGISSSAGKDGNTSILINTIFEELHKENIETELIQLAGLLGGGGKRNCVHGNDMFREVFEKILYTDGIVLGSLYIQPTFLESYDFSGAIVIPFCTSGSSGIAIGESNIRNLGVEYGELLSGKRFSVSSTEKDVSDWLDTLRISEKEKEIKMNVEVNCHLLTATS